ncbi:hypothetical protein ACJX0J_033048, partial [Zea mays]
CSGWNLPVLGLPWQSATTSLVMYIAGQTDLAGANGNPRYPWVLLCCCDMLVEITGITLVMPIRGDILSYCRLEKNNVLRHIELDIEKTYRVIWNLIVGRSWDR